MNDPRYRVAGLEQKYRPVGQDVLQRRMELANTPGQHMWIITAAWLASDPQGAAAGVDQFLDTENMLSFGGPICFKCEQVWSRKLEQRPCTGSATEPMA